MWERIAKAWIWLIFGGILFCISPFFLEPYVVPKNLLASLFFYLTILIVAITGIPAGTGKRLLGFTLLKGLYLIGLAQAFYGITQYCGIWGYSSMGFQVTGSFDNPAGIATVLTLLFPIGIFWLIRSGRGSRIWVSLSLFIYLYAVYCTGSRTAILAVLISSLVLILIDVPGLVRRLGKWRIVTLGIAVILVVVVALYKIRPESANGRLLIWKVCTEMIEDKPLLGFGPGGFQKHYMEYQADYFQQNPDSPFSQLASNIQHPMNLFLKIGVEFGIIGLLVLISAVCYAGYLAYKYGETYRSLVLAAMVAMIACSLFSYPERYPTTWFLLVIYAFYMLKEYRFTGTRSKAVRLILRYICVVVAAVGISSVYQRAEAEIMWKHAVSVFGELPRNTYLQYYDDLYPSLKDNPYFLYNYAAVLNHAGQWERSQGILTRYRSYVIDYDVLLLQGDNAWHLQQCKAANDLFRQAADMIPCRFMPLYKLFEMNRSIGNTEKAKEIAQTILMKDIKIPSTTVFSIRMKAKQYVDSLR